MPPPPAWVVAKLRQLVAQGDMALLIAEHLQYLKFSCTVRQVRRWKVQHGIRRVWAGTDLALDGVVQQLVGSRSSLKKPSRFRYCSLYIALKMAQGILIAAGIPLRCAELNDHSHTSRNHDLQRSASGCFVETPDTGHRTPNVIIQCASPTAGQPLTAR